MISSARRLTTHSAVRHHVMQLDTEDTDDACARRQRPAVRVEAAAHRGPAPRQRATMPAPSGGASASAPACAQPHVQGREAGGEVTKHVHYVAAIAITSRRCQRKTPPPLWSSPPRRPARTSPTACRCCHCGRRWSGTSARRRVACTGCCTRRRPAPSMSMCLYLLRKILVSQSRQRLFVRSAQESYKRF